MGANIPKTFTTEEIARILGLHPDDKWRIKKFMESPEYGIAPKSEASGPGTRRLYGVENIFEIALALLMAEAGLRAEVTGAVLEHLLKKRKRLSAEDGFYLALSRQPETNRRTGEHFYVVVFLDDLAADLEELIEQMTETLGEPPESLVLIAVGPMFQAIKKRLAEMRGEKES